MSKLLVWFGLTQEEALNKKKRDELELEQSQKSVVSDYFTLYWLSYEKGPDSISNAKTKWKSGLVDSATISSVN